MRDRTLNASPFMVADRRQQGGTVLVIALILLLVLTILGVAALNTSALEEKMAASTQEIHRAFQAAEAGLDTGFADPSHFDLNVDVTGKTGEIGAYQAGAKFTVSFSRATNPPVGSLYSATQFSSFHFDLQADAWSRVTDTGVPTEDLEIDDNAAVVTLHGGAFQIGPKI